MTTKREPPDLQVDLTTFQVFDFGRLATQFIKANKIGGLVRYIPAAKIEELRAWVEVSCRMAVARCASEFEKSQGREKFNNGRLAECSETLAELDRLLAPGCSHCGGKITDDCLRCGAPQCCSRCCEETTRELKD